MALKGNLRDVGLNQLLNLINLAHKTGVLTLAKDESVGNARLYFKEGRLIHAAMDSKEMRLTDMMVKVGKLTADQASAVRSRSTVGTDKELGLLMIQSGMLNQNDIVQGVKNYLLDSVYQLFTWRTGSFRFDPNELPPEERITVAVSLDHLIIEGSRRVQEWEQLKDELPDLDVPLKFAERQDTNLRNINLSVEEWRVVSYINPKNSMRQIMRATRMNEVEIRRVVYGLLQAGLVEMIRPEGMPAPTINRQAQFPTQNKHEQVGLLNRLINRIRSL